MDSLLKSAIEYVKGAETIDGHIDEFFSLKLPVGNADDKKRAEQIDHTVEMLRNYSDDGTMTRPVSIVVFGPPGSGKSTFVRAIAEKLTGSTTIQTVNLTQVADPPELIRTFKSNSSSEQHNAQMRIIFFDEFDTTLNGTPLGWLRWFLAPMQDGVILDDGIELPIGKAIFIFAGGTAESLDEFDQRAKQDLNAYRAKKVPDFVSRLRGAIEIGGVNALGNARIVPRALVLKRLVTAQSRKGIPGPPDQVISQILTSGHFVHGVRSMEAFLDAQVKTSSASELPEVVRRQHFTRGLLDGQLVGISAGLNEAASQRMFSTLTRQLLQNGASLAYGGAYIPKGTLDEVAAAAKREPLELGVRPGAVGSARVRNYLGFPASRGDQQMEDSTGIELTKLETLSISEREELGAHEDQFFPAFPEKNADYDPRLHAAWALSLFRLRVRLIQDLNALVVLGGKDDGMSWGRFPGIAEEVMIAIALRKPVYVLGDAGGAAFATGELLGLGPTTPDPRRCLRPSVKPELVHALKPYEHCFQIPGEPDSPIDLKDLQAFLYHRGVTTAAWPRNGLTASENRALFEWEITGDHSKAESAVDLIVKGLSRLDWKP
jgi:hypothetical protein